MLNPCYKTSGDYSDYRIHCAFVCIPNHKKFENFSFKKKITYLKISGIQLVLDKQALIFGLLYFLHPELDTAVDS